MTIIKDNELNLYEYSLCYNSKKLLNVIAYGQPGGTLVFHCTISCNGLCLLGTFASTGH